MPGCTGEYLDHRATCDAADTPNPPPSTQSPMTGVPGATWLAEMALPLLRVTGDGTHVRATLWHRHHDRDVMIWPLWAPPLDIYAVPILLEHPTLRPLPTHQLTVNRTPLAALGVFTVRAAHRIPGPKSAGTLAPIPITTRVNTEPD